MESDESSRMSRIRSGVAKYLNCDKLLFVFGKSNNDNCVVFMYNTQAKDLNDMISPMWLHLEPKDIEKNIADGNPSLLTQLTPMEEQMMGCTLTTDKNGSFFVKLKQAGLQDRDFELITDSSGRPAVLSKIDGKLCRLDYGYAVLKKLRV